MRRMVMIVGIEVGNWLAKVQASEPRAGLMMTPAT